ncbi:spermatogenesis-associated protein 7 [Gavia stellata]|uniref:spermatogenesis-associated protein 7 n=1 Tax=Gavia stellata TaxID=37040 RepID=UPI00289D17D6|nr:spermatogenesis-associated protein 7 [Gavia stellata]
MAAPLRGGRARRRARSLCWCCGAPLEAPWLLQPVLREARALLLSHAAALSCASLFVRRAELGPGPGCGAAVLCHPCSGENSQVQALALSERGLAAGAVKDYTYNPWKIISVIETLELTDESEYPAFGIPRCGPASPFKGHLSTKSNAFCIDSSRSLTSQYLIRDHMVFHYNKILSAKAAVDCSVPKSRLTSIKLADQQRREKLKKKIARCEEEMSGSKTASRSSSRESGRLLPSSFGKSFLEAEDKDGVFPSARQAQYLSRVLSPYGKHGLVRSSPVKYIRKYSQNTSNASNSNSSVSASSTPRKRSGLSCSCSTDTFVSISHSQRCQGSNSKVCSGDLLDRHSEFFTDGRKPFIPRTLISDAKSFLSEYRYYTPARRKRKNHCKQHVEAQTQTDVISFPSADKVSERKVMTEQQKITLKAEDRRYTMDKPERRMAAFPYSFLRETALCSQQSSARRTIEAEDEELLYLAFIEDVTNEILSLGLFSNRVLEQLFECHIQENKNRLDESKMRHLLDVLKADLSCSLDSSAEEIHAGWEAFDSLDLQEFDMMEELEFTSKSQRQRKATKSEEFFRTMDLPLKEPNKCESPVCRESSKETQSKDDFSEHIAETMDAGTGSDSCVKSEDDPDASPSCEAALNWITCDSDLEANKEFVNLEESFAEALQISHL